MLTSSARMLACQRRPQAASYVSMGQQLSMHFSMVHETLTNTLTESAASHQRHMNSALAYAWPRLSRLLSLYSSMVC